MVDEAAPAGMTEAKPKKAKKSKKASASLDTSARQRLWKPRENFEEIAERAIKVWQADPSLVKIKGLTPGKLLSMLKRSKRSEDREKDLTALKKEASDGRLLDAHHAWKGLLDFKAAVNANARLDASLKTSFQELLDFMKTGAKQVNVGKKKNE